VNETRDELAQLLHGEACSSAERCGRWQRDGSPHRDFYELRAQNIIAELEPLTGLANVLPAVRAVLSELDL
jgi:hypothetical protein